MKVETIIGLLSLLIAVIAVIVSVTIPEVRNFLSLDNPDDRSFVEYPKNIKSGVLNQELNLLCRQGKENCSDIRYSANCLVTFLLLNIDGTFIYYNWCTHADKEYYIGKYTVNRGTIEGKSSKYKVKGIGYIDRNKIGISESESFNYFIEEDEIRLGFLIDRHQCYDNQFKTNYEFKISIGFAGSEEEEECLCEVLKENSVTETFKRERGYQLITDVIKLIN